MSQEKESSVLFSIKELMGLEEDRIKAEEAAKAAQLAAMERAKAEAERAAYEAEQARIQAEEERRRLEEQRAREEAARLEAMRQAEVERARVEAENRARMEAAAQQQEHERTLVALQQDKGKKRLRNSLIGLIAGGVLLAGAATAGIVFLVGDNNEKAAAAKASEDAKTKALEDQRRLEQALKESQEKVEQLTNRLASAKTESEKAAIMDEIGKEKDRQTALTQPSQGGSSAAAKRPSGGGGPSPAAAPKPASGGGSKAACKCAPGDPLCSCF